MFRVGQKVVCVDASTTSTNGAQFELTLDAVYTVRWAGMFNGKPCVRLAEILQRALSRNDDSEDWPFRATRFRPLVERKTSIEVFKAMLNPTPEKVLEYQHGFHPENKTRERV